MEKQLAHLPHQTQQEINTLLELITDKIADCQLILLFGNYAQGNYTLWEETFIDGHFESYQSDYDLLVVVDSSNPTSIEQLLRREVSDLYKAKCKNSPHLPSVEFVVEDIHTLSAQLENGHYFYTSLLQEGIVLFDSQKFKLPEPRLLSFQEIRDQASASFDSLFDSTCQLVGLSKPDTGNIGYITNTLRLRQACEHFYKAISLVFTLHCPEERDLEKLRSATKRYSRELSTVFPQKTEFEAHGFHLLNQANEAPENTLFTVTKEEFAYLLEEIEALREITECICKDKIASYEALIN